MFARLKNIVALGISQLPPGASIPEANLLSVLRNVERTGLSFAALGFFGLIALAGMTRTVDKGLDISIGTSPAFAAAPRLSPTVLAPGGMESRYPYSVIPGGVRSVEKLREDINTDPKIAMHYEDFDFTRAHFLTLNRDSAYYVSYRLETGVFWTTERILVRRGEIILTDGASLARARSGGRLSEVPRFPVSSLEPTSSELNVAITTGSLAP